MNGELFAKPLDPKPLRDYQAEAISRLRHSLASGKRRPVLMAPTGAGKTRIASEIISLARQKNRRVAFCVPALALIDQTVQAFWSEGVRDVGVVQADHRMTDCTQPVQICSIQTIARRGYPDCDLVIVDECHEIHDAMLKWISENPQTPFIGLSATPWQRGMAPTYDDLIIVETIAGLTKRGYLTPMRVFAPSHPDLSKVKIIAGEYSERGSSEVMRDQKIIGDVVHHWVSLAEGRPTICFGVDCAHARAIAEQFNDAGIPCGYQDESTSDGERAIIRDQFHDGRLKVVANVGTLVRGVDWDVRCIIDAQPTKSDIRHVQKIGRGLRPANGKSDLLILDHASNTLSLGMVDDIFHDELDDGSVKATERKEAREAKQPKPTECSSCHRLRAVRVTTCPHCGFTPERQSTIHHHDGKLEEVAPKIRGKLVRDKTIIFNGKEFPLSVFFGALRAYADAHGYKAGWPANKYREAVNAWPRAVADSPACPIPPEIASWIKSTQIRWAKSKRNRSAARG